MVILERIVWPPILELTAPSLHGLLMSCTDILVMLCTDYTSYCMHQCCTSYFCLICLLYTHSSPPPHPPPQEEKEQETVSTHADHKEEHKNDGEGEGERERERERDRELGAVSVSKLWISSALTRDFHIMDMLILRVHNIFMCLPYATVYREIFVVIPFETITLQHVWITCPLVNIVAGCGNG